MEQPSAQPFVYLLPERIDTNNAHELEAALSALFDRCAGGLVLDASQLQYISSAGLRVILKCAKNVSSIEVREASPDVYDVFDMTGIATLIPVSRALRSMSVEGLRRIGGGVQGTVWRVDDERVLKVYHARSNPPEKVAREKEVSRQAFIHGVPCAMTFDMVHVGDELGIVYELVDARTVGEVVAASPERATEMGERMGTLLRELHATRFEEGLLPDARDGLRKWAGFAERDGLFPASTVRAMYDVIDAIPDGDTFVHGDFHPGNIMLSEDELVLIDLGDASVGDPLVDLLASYQLMQLICRVPGGAERYTGMQPAQLNEVWAAFARTYFGNPNADELHAIEAKLQFHALLRSMGAIGFSDTVPDGKRAERAMFLNNVFLQGYEVFGPKA